MLCWCGRPGRFNARVVDGEVVRPRATRWSSPTRDPAVTSDTVRYQVLCRGHHRSGDLGPSSGEGTLPLTDPPAVGPALTTCGVTDSYRPPPVRYGGAPLDVDVDDRRDEPSVRASRVGPIRNIGGNELRLRGVVSHEHRELSPGPRARIRAARRRPERMKRRPSPGRQREGTPWQTAFCAAPGSAPPATRPTGTTTWRPGAPPPTRCPRDHEFTVPMADDAEVPAVVGLPDARTRVHAGRRLCAGGQGRQAAAHPLGHAARAALAWRSSRRSSTSGSPISRPPPQPTS